MLDSSLLQKPIIKRAITGVNSNYNSSLGHSIVSPNVPNSARNQLSMSNSIQFYGLNNSTNSKNHSNWPLISQPQTSISSAMTWSNSLNSTLTSASSTSNTSSVNSMQNVWSNNGVYGGPMVNSQKRPPINNNSHATSLNLPGLSAYKKSIYSNENQTMVPNSTVHSPSKYRRNPVMSNFKSYTNNITGPSNLYELGSAGSDNTSSSSDSANLRENGLLKLQVSVPLNSIE